MVLPRISSPGSFHLTSSRPLEADLYYFDDRDGHRWHGTQTLEAVPSDARQFVARIATARAGQENASPFAFGL
jgi:hypothetical protein